MVDLRIVISDPKTGKSYQKTLPQEEAKVFYDKKIGETIKGELIDLKGYEMEIKGGSDASGFPMRWDNEGVQRKKIFATKSIGIRTKGHGVKRRKAVAGNTVYEKTAQINIKVTKYGPEPIEKPKEEEQKESSEEKPKEE